MILVAQKVVYMKLIGSCIWSMKLPVKLYVKKVDMKKVVYRWVKIYKIYIVSRYARCIYIYIYIYMCLLVILIVLWM